MDDLLEVQSPGLDQLDGVGEGAQLRCKQEDGEVVVGDEALRWTAELNADVVQKVGADERQCEAREQCQDLVEIEFSEG